MDTNKLTPSSDPVLDAFVEKFGAEPSTQFRQANCDWYSRLEGYLAGVAAGETDRKDAERYRWLRNRGNPYAMFVIGRQGEHSIEPFYDERLDDAIDRVIGAEKEKG